MKSKNDPVWLVELVISSGAFVVRELDEDIPVEDLRALIDQSFQFLPRPGPWDGTVDISGDARLQRAAREYQAALARPRWLLFHTPSQRYALDVASQLPGIVSSSTLPWSDQDFQAAVEFFQAMERAEVKKLSGEQQ